MQNTARIFAECKDRPDLFNNHVLGAVHPSIPDGLWSRQRDVVAAVQAYRKVCVVAGHGVGKSRLAALISIHYLYTNPWSIVLCLAPSAAQLQSVLWQEIKKLHGESRVPLPGRVVNGNTPRIEVGAKWYLAGRSADSDPERLAGIHAERVLCVLDEASWEGYDTVIETLESLNASNYLLIGNPIRHGRFKSLCDEADAGTPGLKKIQISSLESPHAHLDRSPVGLADKTYIEDMVFTYGEDHPVYRARVLGEFNSDDEFNLIPMAWLEACSTPHAPKGQPWVAADLSAGTGNGDWCVVVVRDDAGVLEWSHSKTWNYPEGVAERVARFASQYDVPPSRIIYDAGGLGIGFGYALKQHGLAGARGYIGGASGGKAATNLRGECAVNFRNRLDPGRNPNNPFSIPHDLLTLIRPELKELRYELAGKEQIKLEPKDKMKVRMKGASPDHLDCILQSYAFEKNRIVLY